MNTKHGAVLIVEDDAFLALDLSDMLQEAGYRVCEPAVDNDGARRLIADFRPTFAFLDYNLGSSTSVPTAVELAQRNIPFVYVTGRPDAVRENPLAPSARILAKPYAAADILAALSE